MQKKFSLLLVVVLALSMIFCFGAIAWAEDAPVDADTELVDEAAEEEAPAEEAAGLFADVPADHWAAEYIADLVEKGITQGTSPTTFSPDATLTRAQFVTFLGRLAGVDAEEHAAHATAFTDISDPAYAYAYGYICWAAEIGVTTGLTPTVFSPGGQLNREQMATMVLRFAKYYGIEIEKGAAAAVLISDIDSVSAWAQEAVAALTPVYISVQDGKFDPKAPATRAQMAQVISLFPVPVDGFVAAPAADPAPEASAETSDEGVVDEEPAEEETPAE